MTTLHWASELALLLNPCCHTQIGRDQEEKCSSFAEDVLSFVSWFLLMGCRLFLQGTTNLGAGHLPNLPAPGARLGRNYE